MHQVKITKQCYCGWNDLLSTRIFCIGRTTLEAVANTGYSNALISCRKYIVRVRSTVSFVVDLGTI
jgi:hypothetical protein